jgi:polar amino acid transport system substrate-binding protein
LTFLKLQFSLLNAAILTTAATVTPLVFMTSRSITPSYAQTSDVVQNTLLMGTEADYIPFGFRYASEPASNIIGFDIALANIIADRLGFNIVVQNRPFEELLPALQSGTLDFAIAAITPTPERQQMVDFSEVYFETRHALVSRWEMPVRTLADLPGKTVAVQQGTIQEQVVLQLLDDGMDIRPQIFQYTNDIITAVRELEVDVAITEELVAEAYLENNPTLEFDVLGELPSVPLAIAFPKGSPHVASFNQVIRELRATGELEQLSRQWFAAQP